MAGMAAWAWLTMSNNKGPPAVVSGIEQVSCVGCLGCRAAGRRRVEPQQAGRWNGGGSELGGGEISGGEMSRPGVTLRSQRSRLTYPASSC